MGLHITQLHAYCLGNNVGFQYILRPYQIGHRSVICQVSSVPWAVHELQLWDDEKLETGYKMGWLKNKKLDLGFGYIQLWTTVFCVVPGHVALAFPPSPSSLSLPSWSPSWSSFFHITCMHAQVAARKTRLPSLGRRGEERGRKPRCHRKRKHTTRDWGGF